jgi:hypothetical protein
LVPQNPQYLASVRKGRRQLGQIVGMMNTPFSDYLDNENSYQLEVFM